MQECYKFQPVILDRKLILFSIFILLFLLFKIYAYFTGKTLRLKV